jgi:hypothetical protein
LGAPKPGTVEVASGAPGTPRVGSVTATQVGDEALKSGTPVGSSPAAKDPEKAESEAGSTSTENIKHKSQDAPEPAKKKKGLFRKIINPF